jgi:hypothetical protein
MRRGIATDHDGLSREDDDLRIARMRDRTVDPQVACDLLRAHVVAHLSPPGQPLRRSDTFATLEQEWSA